MVQGKNDNYLIIYQDDNGLVKVNVRFADEDVWLTQGQLAEIYDTTQQNIALHIKNIYADKELADEATHKKYLLVRQEGNRNVQRNIDHYNLDMIIAIGYRVQSQVATRFRRWATERLREYIEKGFAMDDERLKNLGGGSYFKELLERIRDIRSSEKVFYRQVLDLFATSSDYDAQSPEAKKFFATVQNKMHYAIHHNTASELIYNRVDSEKEFMGLTTFKGDLPTLSEAKVAKNYLTEKELRGLNQLVSGYLDFAERQAEREEVMTMADWVAHVDRILLATGEDLLDNSGSISREQMKQKVDKEYKSYQAKTLSQVEKDYLKEIKSIENITKEGGK